MVEASEFWGEDEEEFENHDEVSEPGAGDLSGADETQADQFIAWVVG